MLNSAEVVNGPVFLTEDQLDQVSGGNAFLAVTSAFAVGWKVGTYLDQTFGLSDSIARWAAGQ